MDKVKFLNFLNELEHDLEVKVSSVDENEALNTIARTCLAQIRGIIREVTSGTFDQNQWGSNFDGKTYRDRYHQ